VGCADAPLRSLTALLLVALAATTQGGWAAASAPPATSAPTIEIASGSPPTDSGAAGATPTGTGQVELDASAPRTRSQIRALMRTEISPTGPASETAAVLTAGGFTLQFKSLVAGQADVDWYNVPPGGVAHAAAAAKTLLIANGSLTFSAPGTGGLSMMLTATGRALLESEAASHIRFLRVTAKATFTPLSGARPITVSLTQSPSPVSGTPRCFGAASQDPLDPCENPSLRFTVTPTPDEALITPNAPCTPVSLTALVNPCTFGASPSTASADVALLGDSHAETWRAAMTVVANTLHWYDISLTRSSCFYSQAIPILPGSLVSQCIAWRAGVVAWFRANPKVRTVFVSDEDDAPAVAARGESVFATEVSGYLAAWHLLPASVKHIVVLRDSPVPGLATGTCVDRAIAHHQDAAVTCGLARASALFPDPEVAAAYEDEPRASVIDMTDFFCGVTVCPPVIGGVLVYKDGSHMTNLYSTTLGPYLLARIRRLVAGWSS
jgi:hypothetical protein